MYLCSWVYCNKSMFKKAKFIYLKRMISRIKNCRGLGWKIALFFLIPAICFADTGSLSSDSSLSFGLIEFASSHDGSVTIATDGGVSWSGSGLFYRGDGVPGRVTVSGWTGTVEIRCDSSATLGDGTGGNLQITDIRVSATGAAPGNLCAGSNPGDPLAESVNIAGSPETVTFGGTLVIPASALSEGKIYKSSTGGTPISISAVFI